MFTPASLPHPSRKTLMLLGDFPMEPAAYKLLLETILPGAGLSTEHFHQTSVFPTRPVNNELKTWTANKTELKKLGQTPIGAALAKRYLLAPHWGHVQKTEAILAELQPDLIIALGSVAQWLLSNDDRIGLFRGTFFQSRFGRAISTFHPSAVLREYKMLPVVTMDLIKARLHLEGTLAAPLKRRLWVNPTWDEIAAVYAKFRTRSREALGVDIETCPTIAQITTISFALAHESICIPFWDRHAKAGAENVYGSAAEELRAWRWVEKFCALPNPKVLQNGMYDMQYMLDAPIELRMAGQIEDTAIMQHAYQPELRKSLGDLASFYTNEPSWKQMRTSMKDAKADD